MSFDAALRFTLGFEGGRVDHPADKGKRTAFGITKQVYDGWRRTHGQPTQDPWLIAKSEIEGIYQRWYWTKVWGEEFDAVDPALGFLLFDAAVHHGCGQSVKWFQRALVSGLSADGIPGPKTLAAAHDQWDAGNRRDVIVECLAARRLLMHQLASREPSQKVFLKGWLTRVGELESVVLATDPLTAVLAVQRPLPKGYPVK